ncbi:hypothetical protein [Mycolicibacterium sphagni]|uniref:hypothetical protein n=1 Tax=Mycolicibacterium sphagni TaxID=1786 RepID=UPI0021F3A9C1|nr:hypothetical protein [Mycolicibacterium sphagni]MCV7179539.1 hypothetical protein [Mycolicibacterium sphagni]
MRDDDFVSIEECGQRMGLTSDQVVDLIERHALRAYRYGGWGEVMVQPAIVNVLPKRKTEAKPRGRPRRK